MYFYSVFVWGFKLIHLQINLTHRDAQELVLELVLIFCISILISVMIGPRNKLHINISCPQSISVILMYVSSAQKTLSTLSSLESSPLNSSQQSRAASASSPIRSEWGGYENVFML